MYFSAESVYLKKLNQFNFKMYNIIKSILPCKYGKNLHIISPNTKSRNNEPINVNGMHKTPNKISETAKFNRNTLVMVRIRRFCTNVNITKPLPITANNKIVAYSGICTRPDDSHNTHGGLLLALIVVFRLRTVGWSNIELMVVVLLLLLVILLIAV